MLISGLWYECDDAHFRPVIRGEVQSADGSWKPVTFLVDTGADRTAFSADILANLQLPLLTPSHQLAGIGGSVASVLIETVIALTREDGSRVSFRGRYAGFPDMNALDMSVLGRELTNLFAVLVDRPGDRVCLLGQKHHYSIHQG